MDYEPSRYGYNDYPAHRYHDYRYRTGDRYSGYRSGRHFDYGDELTYGPKGEPHIASYRFAPGDSHIYPMGRYGGGHYDRYGGGYNSRYGSGYHHSYGNWVNQPYR